MPTSLTVSPITQHIIAGFLRFSLILRFKETTSLPDGVLWVNLVLSNGHNIFLFCKMFDLMLATTTHKNLFLFCFVVFFFMFLVLRSGWYDCLQKTSSCIGNIKLLFFACNDNNI